MRYEFGTTQMYNLHHLKSNFGRFLKQNCNLSVERARSVAYWTSILCISCSNLRPGAIQFLGCLVSSQNYTIANSALQLLFNTYGFKYYIYIHVYLFCVLFMYIFSVYLASSPVCMQESTSNFRCSTIFEFRRFY